jgi:hypothetical protein
MSSTVPSVEFSDAKVHLSDVMTKVVYGRQPRLVRRHRGKEEMILLRPDDLARSLNSFRFHPHLSVRKGEATAELPEVGILGFGTSADEAMTDLVEELRAYARRFFRRGLCERLSGRLARPRRRSPSSTRRRRVGSWTSIGQGRETLDMKALPVLPIGQATWHLLQVEERHQ